ncbi:hypothetical protein RZA67_10680 [Stenotrophomonas sp. C3(2023)]|uniref:MoaF-related domain-containing protein n=1 Tax=Stenotrophomonas sp. C3(2023) TaxID=3080277 RepID=UPI00293CD557|nr:hypothetical protein [Stenotrophomonas sp. C3(2023)]MDV3469185.1 hypothetical protein [Stenotrophomonas sp. C3(2023)]
MKIAAPLTLAVTAALLACPSLATAADTTRLRFPGVNRTLDVDLDNRSYELRFAADGRTMTFKGTRGDSIGDQATVQYQAQEIAPNVWRLTWLRDGRTAVVHTENWLTRKVYVNASWIVTDQGRSQLMFEGSQGTFRLRGSY